MQINHQYRIRYAKEADNVILAEVGAETFFDTFAKDNTAENMAIYLANAFNPEIQAHEIADPSGKFLLIEENDMIAGYAHLKLGPAPGVIRGSKPIEIGRFYARKSWIGKGVGAELMQACLVEADREACDVIWLDVWERNPRAIRFYQKWGFMEVGTQIFQLGDDLQHDLLMVRAVKSEPC